MKQIFNKKEYDLELSSYLLEMGETFDNKILKCFQDYNNDFSEIVKPLSYFCKPPQILD